MISNVINVFNDYVFVIMFLLSLFSLFFKSNKAKLKSLLLSNITFFIVVIILLIFYKYKLNYLDLYFIVKKGIFRIIDILKNIKLLIVFTIPKISSGILLATFILCQPLNSLINLMINNIYIYEYLLSYQIKSINIYRFYDFVFNLKSNSKLIYKETLNFAFNC